MPTYNSGTKSWAARAQYTVAQYSEGCHPMCVLGNKSKGELTNERRIDSQATWVIDVLGLFFDMFPIGVGTIRRWPMPSRLVQELNIFTECAPSKIEDDSVVFLQHRVMVVVTNQLETQLYIKHRKQKR